MKPKLTIKRKKLILVLKQEDTRRLNPKTLASGSKKK